MKKFISTICLFIICYNLNGCSVSQNNNSSEEKQFIHKEYTVNSGSELSLNVKAADLAIRISENDKINLNIRVQASNDIIDKFEITSNDNKDLLKIKIDYPEKIFNNANVDCVLEIPVKLVDKIKINSGAGNIITSKVNIEQFLIHTGAGNIDISNCKSDFDINTGAGNINAQNLSGAIKISSGAGNIKLAQIQKFDDININTGAGNVKLYLNDNVQATLDCVTGIGSVSVDNFSNFNGKVTTASAKGKINDGGNFIKLHSGVGNITINKE